MNKGQVETFEANFISGSKGRLFALHHAPNHITENCECFILVPPFAEEMNRCRYMCTLLAQRVTDSGHGYLSVDPYGTGDSSGDFVEATWEIWLDDLKIAFDYAEKLGYRNISLIGIRIGALLAMELAGKIGSLRRILLWQPVISGKTALTQFLRIRIAASLDRDEDKGTIAEFENLIQEGKPVEVAGYDVSPALFVAIQEAHLSQYLDFSSAPINWFNTLASEDRRTPSAELSFIEKWRAAGANIDHVTVVGPCYWAAHERSIAPALLDATLKSITTTD